jgi:KDO2-lipid IV(A) lauroyltransferase
MTQNGPANQLPLLDRALARRALLWGSRHLSPSAKIATTPIWAAIPFLIAPRARRQIARNLEEVLGPASPAFAAARAYRTLLAFAKSLADSYAAHSGRGIEVAVEISGDEHLRAARARGRGVVLATGHIGPWQLGPYLLEQAGHAPVVVAMARERDPRAHELEERLELRRRFHVVYTDGALASLTLLAAMRQGGLCALQMDRPPDSAAGARTVAPLFGRAAAFALGPAALARACEAPLIPVFLLYQGARRVRVAIEPPVAVARSRDRTADLAAATAKLAGRYEACIRAHPYQWFRFEDVWRS